MEVGSSSATSASVRVTMPATSIFASTRSKGMRRKRQMAKKAMMPMGSEA